MDQDLMEMSQAYKVHFETIHHEFIKNLFLVRIWLDSRSRTNDRYDVDNIFGIKRKRDGDKSDFSTQDSANTRTTNVDIRKTDDYVTPNITVNIENVITYLYYIATDHFYLKFYNM